MPHRVKDVAYRTVISRLLLELTRGVAICFLGEEDFGSNASDVILVAGVFIGQFTGQQMTISSLARCVGMPQPSVYRRLKSLEERGIAKITGTKSRATLSISKLNDQDTLKLVENLRRAVLQASEELSESNS
jgi:DNA-binding transcriptional ArsR family regulator